MGRAAARDVGRFLSISLPVAAFGNARLGLAIGFRLSLPEARGSVSGHGPLFQACDYEDWAALPTRLRGATAETRKSLQTDVPQPG